MLSEKLLRTFEPKGEWLKFNSHIHNIDHLARTFILQELICEELAKQGKVIDREALRYGAMAHDVGRTHDGYDEDHGRASAKWIHDNLADKMSPQTLDTATYIVHWHSLPDDAAPLMTLELQILKDADGLDRVRLGDLDPTRLRTKPAKHLMETAQKLYDLSLIGANEVETFENVVSAAKQLGICAQ